MNSLSEQIIGLYERHADHYVADRSQQGFEGAWLDRFAALVPPGAAVLDIGCGFGEPIARYLINRGSHGEAIGSYRGEPLYHASLGDEEYQTLLASNGFRVQAHVVEDPDCGHHTVWLAQMQQAGAS